MLIALEGRACSWLWSATCPSRYQLNIYSCSYLSQTNNALTQTMLVRNKRPITNERYVFLADHSVSVQSNYLST